MSTWYRCQFCLRSYPANAWKACKHHCPGCDAAYDPILAHEEDDLAMTPSCLHDRHERSKAAIAGACPICLRVENAALRAEAAPGWRER